MKKKIVWVVANIAFYVHLSLSKTKQSDAKNKKKQKTWTN